MKNGPEKQKVLPRTYLPRSALQVKGRRKQTTTPQSKHGDVSQNHNEASQSGVGTRAVATELGTNKRPFLSDDELREFKHPKVRPPEGGSVLPD